MDKLCVLLLCVTVHLGWGSGYKFGMCDDCIPITKCKEALPYMDMTNKNLEYIAPFFCGLTRTFNVCCRKLKGPSADEVMLAIQRKAKLKLLPDSCGNIYKAGFLESRIISGVFANIYEYPWMVLIAYDTMNGIEFKCSGTLINSRYVLTAAHCIQGQNVYSTRIGEYEIGKDRDCDDNNICESTLQDINVEEEIIHENYNKSDYFANDIGLLRLEKDVDLSFKNTGTICLPVTEELQNKPIAKRHAIVAGWGVTEFKKQSSLLLKVRMPVLSNEDCPYFDREISPSKLKRFCAGEYEKDSCQGDSGGPLMIEDFYKKQPKMVQFGIISNGPIKCGSAHPGLYTDVRQYINWILDHIKE